MERNGLAWLALVASQLVLACIGCGSNDGAGPPGGGGSTADGSSGSGGSDEGGTEAGTGGASGTGGAAGQGGSGGGNDGGDEASGTGGSPGNHDPQVTSTPETPFKLWQALGGSFDPDRMFISSSRTDEVRVYDTANLAFLLSFTHALFSEVDSPLFTYGPNGTAFNSRGNLVVAAYSHFVEFSDYGVEFARYPKVASEATENITFDPKGNLYTTTATGGSNELRQYAAADYSFVQSIDVPAGFGEFTGITFDSRRRLYVASQGDNAIHVAEADANFTTFTWKKSLSGAGNPGALEGLQFNMTGELLAAAGDMIRYDPVTETVIGSFDAPGDAIPVPVRVDNLGNIYTADYENGSGTLPADIFKFASDGSSFDTVNDPDLWGPFGLAISGTVLAGDPPVKWTYQLVANDADGDTLTWTLSTGPTGMILDASSGLLEWWVTSADVGLYDVEVQVDDGNGGVDTQAFQLEISGK